MQSEQKPFILHSEYQPKAIAELVKGFKEGNQFRTLLGVTGSGKTFTMAENCFQDGYCRDSINRFYYAVFYAVKAVLALEGKDFKRHKDVMAYFNQTYVAGGQIPREFGRKIGQLQQKREKSDYDDFFIVSKEPGTFQLQGKPVRTYHRWERDDRPGICDGESGVERSVQPIAMVIDQRG